MKNAKARWSALSTPIKTFLLCFLFYFICKTILK